MIVGNALKIALPNLSDEMFLADAPEGQHNGFWLKVTQVSTAKDAVAAASAADVLAHLNHAFGSFLLEDRLGVKGERKKGAGRKIYESATGQDLQIIHQFATRTALACDLLGKAVLAGADVTVVSRVYVPFAIPWILGAQKRPGHTQVRSLFIKVQEKNEAAFGGAGGDQWVRKAGTFISYEIEFDSAPGQNEIVPILSLGRVTEARKTMTGPAGLTVLAYETTPLAATPLSAFKVFIGDGVDETLVHDVRDPDDLAAQFKLDHQDAEQDITGIGTPFFWVEEGVDMDELPHGVVTIDQANLDLSPQNGRYLHFPEHDAAEVLRQIGNAAALEKRPVFATIAPITSPHASPGAASTGNALLYYPDDARFVTEPGILGTTDGGTQVIVPDAVIARSAQGASASKADGSSKAAAARAEKVVALRIPGATDSNGHGKGDQREEVRKKFAGVQAAAR
jgi:hypothetical protein